MANPLVPLGNLNRVLASVVFDAFPQLNVSASNTGSDGISLSFDGAATTMIDVMTGMVTSPEPYLPANLMLHLLRTQYLATAYQAQFVISTLIQDCLITPDSAQLAQYPLVNCALIGVRELPFAGKDAGFVISIKGTYYINSAMYV
jgi:hypothetical protein